MVLAIELSPTATAALIGFAGVAITFLLLARWTRSTTDFKGPSGKQSTQSPGYTMGLGTN